MAMHGDTIAHTLYHLYMGQITASIEFPYTRETRMYIDPITRQTFYYATSIKCGNNPQNIFELDPDANDADFFVKPTDPLNKKKHHKRFNLHKLKQQKLSQALKHSITPEQDSSIHSNAELDQF